MSLSREPDDSGPVATLVTGGAGFLGSHVVDTLIGLGRRVVVLDDLSTGCLENLNAAAHFVQGSILDESLINRLFREQCFAHVFHLAGFAAERLSHVVRRHNYEVNVVGSANLINACLNHGVECFVYSSSAAVYGRGSRSAEEDSSLRPLDPYGIAKMAVERDLAVARDRFGLQSVVFRAHNVYGERQNIRDPNRNVVGIFIHNALEGRPLPIHGDGSQRRPFSHVSDVAPVIALAPSVPGARNETFNVGACESVSVRRLAEIVSEAAAAPLRLRHIERPDEVKDVLCSHEKVHRVFGLHRETVTLEVGVRRMVAWARRAIGSSRFQPRIEVTTPPSRRNA
jgi:UDP-glucose 4-epimerase